MFSDLTEMKKYLFLILAEVIIIRLTISCGNDNESPEISGSLVNSSQCKTNKSASPAGLASDTQSCVEYSYNRSAQKLSLKHINTAFNCCPGKLSCTITVKGDTLVIAESAKEALCDCMCLYDLEIEVKNLASGKYEIKFAGPYRGAEPHIQFEVDLASHPEGNYCVNRSGY